MDISYSDIEFSIVKTNELSFTPVWSEDGTAYLYTRVYVDIEGILNPQAMAYDFEGGMPVQSSGILPPATVVNVRHALLQPRGQLLITTPDGVSMTPVTVVESPVLGLTVDMNNGPRPISCTIRNLAGARTWFISWTCETWIHECADENSIDNPILSNRYSQSEEIDEQWKSTRTTTGVVMFRADILENSAVVADDFRSRVLPAVPKGYQRRSIHVTAVPSRNALHYSVSDQERMFDLGDTAAAGTYITDVEGTYGVTSLATPEGIPGGMSLGQLFIRIRADKRASNWIITQRAFALAAGKLPLGVAGPGFIQHIAINQSLVDRDISLNIVYKFVPEQDALIGSVATASLKADSIFPDFKGDNPDPPWGKGSRGTANLKLLVAALEDACRASPAGGEVGGVVASDDEQTAGDLQEGPDPVVSVTATDELPRLTTGYSYTGNENPYSEYTAEVRYRRNNGILMAPLAGLASGNGDGTSNDPTAVFFRIHQPTSTVIVRWRSERIGKSPQVPAPDSNNANYALLDHEIVTIGPQVMADAITYVYRVEGEYTYGCKHPMGFAERLGMGSVPWVAATFVDLVVQSSDYEHGIIDDDAGSGPGTGFVS